MSRSTEVHCLIPDKATGAWRWPLASFPPLKCPDKIHGTTLSQYGIVLLWNIGTLPFICYWLQRLIFLLDAFARLRKATLSFLMSVRLSAWNNSSHTGRIFMKFYIWPFFEALFKKIQLSLKSDKNNRYFTWRQINILDHYALDSSRMRNISDKTYTENQNAHFMFKNVFPRKSYRLWDNVAGNRWHYTAQAHCMPDTYSYKHTLIICNK